MSVVYEATLAILEEYFSKINISVLPNAADQLLYRTQAIEFWNTVTQKVSLFQKALIDSSESGDQRRCEIRRDYTLGKPIVQLALIRAILRLQAPQEDGSRVPVGSICDRINDTDWSVKNHTWQHVLMIGDKVITGKQAMMFATRFIAYILGQKLADRELDVLKEQYSSQFPTPKALPKPLY